MTYSAITYRVKAGHEDELARVFATFTRADSPVLHDENGAESGLLLGTALFVKDDLMVRVIHHTGPLTDVGRHMAGQSGVREAERRLAPLLAEHRDTGTSEAFLHYFTGSGMRCIQQLTLPAELLKRFPVHLQET